MSPSSASEQADFAQIVLRQTTNNKLTHIGRVEWTAVDHQRPSVASSTIIFRFRNVQRLACDHHAKWAVGHNILQVEAFPKLTKAPKKRSDYEDKENHTKVSCKMK